MSGCCAPVLFVNIPFLWQQWNYGGDAHRFMTSSDRLFEKNARS